VLDGEVVVPGNEVRVADGLLGLLQELDVHACARNKASMLAPRLDTTAARLSSTNGAEPLCTQMAITPKGNLSDNKHKKCTGGVGRTSQRATTLLHDTHRWSIPSPSRCIVLQTSSNTARTPGGRRDSIRSHTILQRSARHFHL
jgi:hypothetical protein